MTQGAGLITGVSTTAVSADTSYDSDEWVKTIEVADAMANIPPRSNRINQRPADGHRYKARHLVEGFFNRFTPFCRIATRYDKLSSRFSPCLPLACAYVWLP
jgi:transposase